MTDETPQAREDRLAAERMARAREERRRGERRQHDHFIDGAPDRRLGERRGLGNRGVLPLLTANHTAPTHEADDPAGPWIPIPAGRGPSKRYVQVRRDPPPDVFATYDPMQVLHELGLALDRAERAAHPIAMLENIRAAKRLYGRLRKL